MNPKFISLFIVFILIKITTSFSQQKELIYENSSDTLHNFYCVYKPVKETKAVLILLPAYYEFPHWRGSYFRASGELIASLSTRVI